MKSIFNFYLYTSMHISLCAVSIYVFTCLIFNEPVDYHYLSFLFAGTLIIYNVHRISSPFFLQEREDRYAEYKKRSHWLFVLIALGILIAVYSYFQLSTTVRIGLIIGIVLSITYTVPVLSRGRKLRDLPYVKIFLIAVVWTYLTIVLPFYNVRDTTLLSWLSVERVLFFIAITIPFDIRDYSIDQSTSLGTIPTKLGVKRARLLSICLIVINVLIVSSIWIMDKVDWSIALSYAINYLIALWLINRAHENKSDYLFTFWLDATIAFPLLICVFIGCLK